MVTRKEIPVKLRKAGTSVTNMTISNGNAQKLFKYHAPRKTPLV